LKQAIQLMSYPTSGYVPTENLYEQPQHTRVLKTRFLNPNPLGFFGFWAFSVLIFFYLNEQLGSFYFDWPVV